jgi:hemolysin activation/secretion protein
MRSSDFFSPARRAAAVRWFFSSLLVAPVLFAQDLNRVQAVPVLPRLAPPAENAAPEIPLFAARPGEKVVLERLVGVRFVTSTADLGAPGFPAAGLDVSRVPALQRGGFVELNRAFLERPASRESLDRLVAAARIFLRTQGRTFVSVYLPPQDITGGYVQIVVSEARAEGPMQVVGARHFSEGSYLAAVHQSPGAPLDEAQIAADLAWLNRNPFRHVVAGAEPGAAAGTTRLTLRTQEQLPWSVAAGYDNTGTPATDEDRVTASVTWGNALGRGDLATYRFTADPNLERSISHSGSYTAFLPWRHVLTLLGAWSRIDSLVTPPFSQVGHSWQIGARYEIPLRPWRNGWSQNLTLLADFKYSDNNLEFATIPVVNNVTHIAQAGVSYGVGFAEFGGQNSATATVYASPGGVDARNGDRAFAGSRPGAKAEYVYGQLALSHSHPLTGGWSWTTAVNLQWASGPLLGSEQLNGGGAYGVRGYGESSGFGDQGLVINNELHAPPQSVFKGRDRLDGFVFFDAASLNLRGDDDSSDLRSAGVGINYAFGRHFSVRAAYGWQLKSLDRSTEHAHGHLSALVTW